MVQAILVAKNQVDYDGYMQQISNGQKPAEDLPLLNALVNTVADVYACTEPTFCIAGRTIATTQAQALCRAVSPAQCKNIISRVRGTQLQQSIQTLQFT